MPASQTGFANMFLERNLSMAAGYHIPVLGCPPGIGQQQPHHLAAMAGVPLAYSGLQGYNFIPYSHHRHITHMNNSFELKAASPYHQALLARGGPFYPLYRPGPGATDHDPGRGVAKVATRESTSALKAWLNEHLKNPYPTKGEKIMLAIVTKMSLTQVSTWFANARRRLKKENRVSWASNKGKSDEEDESESEDEGGEARKSRLDEDEADPQTTRDTQEDAVVEGDSTREPLDTRAADDTQRDSVRAHEEEKCDSKDEEGRTASRVDSKEDVACLKPKIWSLAETAISETVHKSKDSSSNLNIGPDVGKWWAEWASMNGMFIPACYSAHDAM